MADDMTSTPARPGLTPRIWSKKAAPEYVRKNRFTQVNKSVSANAKPAKAQRRSQKR